MALKQFPRLLSCGAGRLLKNDVPPFFIPLPASRILTLFIIYYIRFTVAGPDTRYIRRVMFKTYRSPESQLIPLNPEKSGSAASNMYFLQFYKLLLRVQFIFIFNHNRFLTEPLSLIVPQVYVYPAVQTVVFKYTDVGGPFTV